MSSDDGCALVMRIIHYPKGLVLASAYSSSPRAIPPSTNIGGYWWLRERCTQLVLCQTMYHLGIKYRQVVGATLIYGLICGCLPQKEQREPQQILAVPIASASISKGKIELTRTYGAALEAPAQFSVAPKISGRIEQLYVDMGDSVSRNQIVAELENDEYEQEVIQARADLTVAQAQLRRASTSYNIASLELKRVETLRKRGISSEAQLDTALATKLQRRSEQEVAQAEIARAKAQLDAAQIRLDYTKVRVSWNSKNGSRVVARRFASVGSMVAENSPLFSIVELDPITCVIYVAEKDYRHLKQGQVASLSTDAYPKTEFQGTIERIAPVFEPGSRQARVELLVNNKDHVLVPGMFVLATLTLRIVANATLVPDTAITKRNDQLGIFLVSKETQRVRWQPVRVGIQNGQYIELLDLDNLSGQVVTVGHHLLDDGSLVSFPAHSPEKATP